MPPDTLTPRQLNRATLARQMLLAREEVTPVAALERLAGLQAQLARPPFIGLWTRIEGFTRAQLLRVIRERKAVRGTLMRGTIHLVSARDFVAFRPAIQPVLDDGMRRVFRDLPSDADVATWVAEARTFFGRQPATFDALRTHMVKLHPKANDRAMGFAPRMKLPLVQVPGESPWGYPGAADFAPAETWLGKKIAAAAKPDALMLRYLAAFGPASVADAQTWSGLAGLKPVFESLRPKLRAFRDERGRELFDLPDAPRPAKEPQAPVRFLPEYDNLLLAYADRTRIVPERHREKMATRNLQVLATFTVDGFVAGAWKVERKRAAAMLQLTPFEPLGKPAHAALEREGAALLRFIEDDAETFDVRIGKPPPGAKA